jgi:hypothetical protein
MILQFTIEDCVYEMFLLDIKVLFCSIVRFW